MKPRRSLDEGLRPSSLDPAIVEEFIHGRPKPERQTQPQPSVPAADPAEGKTQTGNPVGRAPLTIRFRADYADALKRASLERQLKKQSPNKLQDILEEAVEPWLRSNGYIT
jgi:hypothetical protein